MGSVRPVIALAVVSTIVRAWLAWRYSGFSSGDDAELVQEAFRFAFGLDYAPWTIRSVTASAVLVAPVLELASLFGVSDPAQLALIARYPFVILGGVNVVLVFLVARKWASDQAATLASALYAVHWIALVFGSATYPRVAATTALLLAVLLLERPFFAGLLVGFAFSMRFSEIVFLPAMLYLLPGRREMARHVAGFAAGALLFVHPWSSVPEFMRFTFVQQASSSLRPEQPAWWYLQTLPQWISVPLWPFLLTSPRRRALALVVLPVALLSVVGHKELRYLQPVVAFAMILIAVSAVEWWDLGWKKTVATLLVLAFPLQLGRIRSIERRSAPAVEAAQFMSDRGVRRVALSQVWAYGGRVYLGNGVEVADLEVPPRPDRVRIVAPRMDCMAMYRAEVTPETRAVLKEAGLTESYTFSRDRGRTVEVLCTSGTPAFPPASAK
jgi:hypothetical protein